MKRLFKSIFIIVIILSLIPFNSIAASPPSPTNQDESIYAIAAGLMDYQRAGTYKWRNVAEIYEGTEYLLGLKKDGTLLTVGKNNYGELNVSDWTDIVSVDTGSNFTVGLKKDGTVVATGLNKDGQCNVSGWKNVKKIITADNFTLGLTNDGKVLATGNNKYGQCNTSKWTKIKEIYIGKNNVFGLKSDGTVVAVGNNDSKQCNVSGWKDIVSLSPGEKHTAGVKKNGTVVAVGYNDKIEVVGLSTTGPVYSTSRLDVKNWKDIVKVACGSTFTVGLKKNGDVMVSGAGFKHSLNNVDKRYNLYGSPWKNIVDIDIYEGEGIIGLDKSGKVYQVIDSESLYPKVTSYKYKSMQYDVDNLRNITSIRTENDLVVVKTKDKSQKVDDRFVYFGEPREIPQEDLSFLDELSDFYPPKDELSEKTKYLYKRYFGFYNTADDWAKLKKVDRIIRLKPSKEVLAIAQNITKGIQNDYDKARAVHDWVAANVYYDIDYYASGAEKVDTELGKDKVLIGVCANYASITADLLNAINIPCSTEIGPAAGLLGWDSHAWNEAYVNGKWIILDTTWDSPNEYSSIENKFYSDGDIYHNYFDCSLDFFVQTHHVLI